MRNHEPGSSTVPIAVVTAAGQGIGGGCARALAAAGYRVVVSSRGEGAQALADELGGLGVQCDVSRPADLERLVDTALSAFGRIDALVYNTGHPAKGPLLGISDEDWHGGLDLLLLGLVRLARWVTPVMERQGGGALVSISSLAAEEPDTRFPVSSVVRAGLHAFTKLYAERYARAGIRANVVVPGFVANHPVDEATIERIPLGRAVSVEEVSRMVVFLVSPAASGITGQAIRVDGGLGRS